jgi:hypothetical protein
LGGVKVGAGGSLLTGMEYSGALTGVFQFGWRFIPSLGTLICFAGIDFGGSMFGDGGGKTFKPSEAGKAFSAPGVLAAPQPYQRHVGPPFPLGVVVRFGHAAAGGTFDCAPCGIGTGR